MRVLMLVLFIILATFGIGITDNVFNRNRERYQNRRTHKEQTERERRDDQR